MSNLPFAFEHAMLGPAVQAFVVPSIPVAEIPKLLDYGQLGLNALILLLVVGPTMGFLWRFMSGNTAAVRECAQSMAKLGDTWVAERRYVNAKAAKDRYAMHDHISDVEDRLSVLVGQARDEARIGACRYGQTPPLARMVPASAPRFAPPADPDEITQH